METRIILGGGGSAEDERAALQQFAHWVGTDGPVLYLPVAMPEAGQAQRAWFEAAMGPLGVGSITMWTDLRQHEAAEVAGFAGIFIGGGNTYHLLRELRRAGFMPALRAYASAGGVLYGGSAGAIVMGRDIETCAHMDENIAGIHDTKGMDLAHGRAIWCHYTPADDGLIAAYLKRKEMGVIALAETAALWVRGPNELVPLGSAPVIFK